MSNFGTAASGQVLTSRGSGVAPSFLAPNTFLTAAGTFTALANRGYILSGASTVTLPSSPSVGDVLFFICDTASSVVLTANASHVINIQNTISNYGGTATSAALGNSIALVYNSNATAWDAFNLTGTWTLNTFLPSSVSANKICWIDGADPLGTGTPPADGTNVLAVDKFSLTTTSQATVSRRPVFNTNVQNSLGSLKSTAASITYLTCTSAPTYSSPSLIMLVSPSTAASAYIFGSSGTSSTPAFISNFGGVSYEWFNIGDRYTLSAGATGLNLLEIYQVDGVSLVGYLNGTQVFSHVPTVAISSASLNNLFSASPGLNQSTLTLSELIFFRSILTTAQQLNIRRYIAQKWALSIAS